MLVLRKEPADSSSRQCCLGWRVVVVAEDPADDRCKIFMAVWTLLCRTRGAGAR
jgi:hypothetical protein